MERQFRIDVVRMCDFYMFFYAIPTAEVGIVGNLLE